MIPLKDDNPTSSFPFITVFLIALNAGVYLFTVLLGEGASELFILKSAAIPYEIAGFSDIGPRDFLPPPLTIFTSMFVHGGLFHLLGNMLYLWIFGDNIEDRLGHFKFLLFYLFFGAVASLTHIMLQPHSKIPLIGASGAVAAVLGAYFVLYPGAKVLTLLFFIFFVQIVKIPAVIFLGLWFLLQVLSSTAGGGIAWYAHIGGFIAGAAFIFLIKKHPVKG